MSLYLKRVKKENTITLKNDLTLLEPVSILSTKSRLDHLGDKTMNYRVYILYRSLSKIHPWVMNLSGCSKRGVGVLSRTLSLKNRSTPLESSPPKPQKSSKIAAI